MESPIPWSWRRSSQSGLGIAIPNEDERHEGQVSSWLDTIVLTENGIVGNKIWPAHKQPKWPYNRYIKRTAPPMTNNTQSLKAQHSPAANEHNMGATVSQFWAPPPITVGLIGLRSAGKTTIVHKLSGNSDPVMPSVETVEVTPIFQGNQQFKLFDYAGNPHWRPCWRSFMSRLQAVVFVIDSTDKETLQEAKVELVGLLKEDMLEQQPFLVLANKQDALKAMSVAEFTEYLDIQQYLDKPSKCRVEPTSALTGEGLAAGLEWVRDVLREHRN